MMEDFITKDTVGTFKLVASNETIHDKSIAFNEIWSKIKRFEGL